MKSRFSALLRGACVALLFTAAASAEHVRNGDFSDGVRFWNVTTPQGLITGKNKAEVLTSTGASGGIWVDQLRKGGRGQAADVRLWQKIITLLPGKAYRLEFQARTGDVGTQGTVNVRFGKAALLPDGNHNTIGGLPITHFDVSDEWARFSYDFIFNATGDLVLPADYEHCWLTFAVGNMNRFELRGVSIVEVP